LLTLLELRDSWVKGDLNARAAPQGDPVYDPGTKKVLHRARGYAVLVQGFVGVGGSECTGTTTG